ncbi:response regulator transcription factor [Coraliomargarita algicola]|uniref:Response regulator transcription factor n=1 Tax=Coraliomargarita algicola TaxID=3092156 RepID=A0ABZ0RNA4_9BACT|nr:response regulator transcription factor [Coraliomargarita sp. J2-16]WPJ96245.1 response regulator transcription factor [Coraliomargarita sp. J2-16]
MEKQIKLILIEDSPAYRNVIKRTLEGEPDITLIQQYGTAEIALRNLQDRSHDAPDIILLDLNLPGMNGLDALHWINEYTPKTKTIILTQSNQEADILHAISKGAAGYLLKSNTLDQLTEGIRTVMNGGASLDPTVAKYIIGTMKKNTPSISHENPLSEREMEVLTLISEGLQKKEVAQQLRISPRTVAAHVEKIYEKLDVTNAPAAVNRAHERGFFHR